MAARSSWLCAWGWARFVNNSVTRWSHIPGLSISACLNAFASVSRSAAPPCRVLFNLSSAGNKAHSREPKKWWFLGYFPEFGIKCIVHREAGGRVMKAIASPEMEMFYFFPLNWLQKPIYTLILTSFLKNGFSRYFILATYGTKLRT